MCSYTIRSLSKDITTLLWFVIIIIIRQTSNSMQILREREKSQLIGSVYSTSNHFRECRIDKINVFYFPCCCIAGRINRNISCVNLVYGGVLLSMKKNIYKDLFTVKSVKAIWTAGNYIRVNTILSFQIQWNCQKTAYMCYRILTGDMQYS